MRWKNWLRSATDDLWAPWRPQAISRCSAHSHVPDRRPRPGGVHAPRDLVRGVAFDRLDRAVGADALHHADVLVPNDQVARVGPLARSGGHGAAGALGPGV